MKVTLKLTMDGLMRALKARAHRLAEEIEAGRVPQAEAGRRGRPVVRRPSRLNDGERDGGGD